jgi:hypothetical protein
MTLRPFWPNRDVANLNGSDVCRQRLAVKEKDHDPLQRRPPPQARSTFSSSHWGVEGLSFSIELRIFASCRCLAKLLEVTPRIGHLHIVVDDAPWHWADASGEPLILNGFPRGLTRFLSS